MTSCVFCDIISRKIPGKIIFENKKTLAFLSNKADVSGLILIIQKDHCTNLNDITDENFIELQRTLLKINNHIINTCGYTGVNILMASGESAGQSIQHIHFHLIPRNFNDSITAWPELSKEKQETSDVLYQKLKITF